jgi:diguanylate cyclase (GGDEF)-like protein/PAS domain S-box-containing protein
MASSGANTSGEHANEAEVVMTDRSKISELIERSSLGTAAARSLRQRTPPAVAQKILDRAAEHDRATIHVKAINSFARRWVEVIGDTTYLSMGRDELVQYLLGLTQQLVDAALAAEFDRSVGRQVGAKMVAAHFTGNETLAETLALLFEGLPRLMEVSRGVDVASRTAQLVGSMAAGYADALRERSLDEQAAIYSAGSRARRWVEQALAASEAKFRAVFTEAAIGIGIGDLEGNIADANPALQQMFGYTREEFSRLNVSAMIHPDDAASMWEIYEALIRGERDQIHMEKRFYRSDGAEIWTDLTVSLVRDEAGAPAYQVALVNDVSERRRLQAKLEYQAYHDPLTGLANHAMFTERLGRVFAEPVDQRRVALCFLDLDEFKKVNDSLGHDVGDQLLKAVASRLTRCCGSGQLVARMSGDEFVIFIEDSAGEGEVVALADAVLAEMARPIRIGDHELTVTTSIGIVERPVAGTNLKDLIQAADITLYRAKASGGARYAMFDITADGVETPAQLKRFPAVGYDADQGSLSGPPGIAEQIDALMRAATELLCELNAQES